MSKESEKLVCSNCDNAINADDDFCPNCGVLFTEGVKCVNHEKIDADGVCIICCEPFCKDCGLTVNDLYFVCDEHDGYEIIEGMARIYGSSDSLEIECYKNSLEKEGFHPIIYSRKVSPISIGSPDYTLFKASGEFNGHIINEYKLMVPCQEVLPAEKILDELIK
jgi:hypothetical protein